MKISIFTSLLTLCILPIFTSPANAASKDPFVICPTNTDGREVKPAGALVLCQNQLSIRIMNCLASRR